MLSRNSDGTLAVTDVGSTRLVAYCEDWWNAGHGAASTNISSPSRSSPSVTPQEASPAFEPVEQLAVSFGSALVAAAATRGGLQVFSTPWTDPRCALLASYRCPQVRSRFQLVLRYRSPQVKGRTRHFVCKVVYDVSSDGQPFLDVCMRPVRCSCIHSSIQFQ